MPLIKQRETDCSRCGKRFDKLYYTNKRHDTSCPYCTLKKISEQWGFNFGLSNDPYICEDGDHSFIDQRVIANEEK